MSRYSPSSQPYYSRSSPVGDSLDLLTRILLDKKAQEREDLMRRQAQAEADRRFNLQLGLQGVRPASGVDQSATIAKPGTWLSTPRWEDVGEGYVRDVTTTPEWADALREADRRKDRFAMTRAIQSTDPSVGLEDALALSELATRQPGAGGTLLSANLAGRAAARSTAANRATLAGEQQRLYDMAIGMGMTPAEARAVAGSGKGDDMLADLATLPYEERIRARYRPPSTSTAKDPAQEREDDRRTAMQARAEARARQLAVELGAEEPERLGPKGEMIPNPRIPGIRQTMDRYNRTADSLASARGLPPGATPPEFSSQGLQQALQQANQLAEAAIAQGHPRDEVLAELEKARQRIYQRFNLVRGTP